MATGLSIGKSGNLQFRERPQPTASPFTASRPLRIAALAQATATGASSAAAILRRCLGRLDGGGVVGTALAGSGRGVISARPTATLV